MNESSAMILVVLLSSFLAGVVIFFLDDERHRTMRTAINLAAAVVKLIAVVIMLWGVFHDRYYELYIPMGAGLDLAFRADSLAMLLSSLSALLWLVTTIYAIGYMEGSPNRSRFFGFFSLCVTATMGIALANNLFTFFIFYEMLTLATYPLIVHQGTGEALRAGRVYLTYALGGGSALLLGMIWLRQLTGPLYFAEGGVISHLGATHAFELKIIFALLIAGLGVKAACFPLHGWLPQAMVAPAPVSALLHAVAVVKAGAFGIVRIVYDAFGIGFSQELGVLAGLGVIASITILYGSLRALFQDDLKKRLAWSTVSQVSYIALGTAIFGPIGTVGGLVHLIHQGIMKITLFFCAGNLAETLHIHRISEMRGVGKRMPWTMAAFTIAAFGMIGVPPLAGFVSKWHLGAGAVQSGQLWIIAVLIGSSVLNAAYFLPILHAAWFQPADAEWPAREGAFETSLLLLTPPVFTALSVIAIGLFAGLSVSPLTWAKLIISREYPGGYP